MVKKRQNILLFFVLLLIGCAPYDSNKTNKDMLQGGWLMHEMYREEEDSTFIPDFLPEDSVILQFEGNSYTEFFGKDDRKLGLTFDVYDYRLILYRNDTIYDWINIDVLTEDSLVLSKVDYKWQYKRVQ